MISLELNKMEPNALLPLTQPTVETPPPPPGGTMQTTVSKKGRIFKKLFILLALAALVAIAAFFIIKILLPNIGISSPFTKEVTLTWWGLWENENEVKPLIEEYQKEHPKVKITYVVQSKEEYRERLTNSLSQGKGPDIFRIHNTWVPMFKGKLSPLPSEILSSQEFSQTFYPVAASDLTTADGIVGIPLMYDGLGLFINEEIFATYGKFIPKTWDELRDTAVELTIKDEGGVIQQAGVAMGRTENVDHWQEILALMMIQNKVDLTKPMGERAEGALKYFTSISKDYQVWDETLPPSTIYFASGKLAMYFGPSWRAFEIWQQNPNLKFKVVSVPQLPTEDPTEPAITLASYWVESVWSGTKYPKESWSFLKFLSQKENLEKLYQLETQSSPTRHFGELYSRVDMRDLLLKDSITSGFMELAPTAKSWYLVSRTFDGPTGINARISDYFKDAVNEGARGDYQVTQALNTAASGVQQVLVDYGLIAAPLPSPKK